MGQTQAALDLLRKLRETKDPKLFETEEFHNLFPDGKLAMFMTAARLGVEVNDAARKWAEWEKVIDPHYSSVKEVLTRAGYELD